MKNSVRPPKGLTPESRAFWTRISSGWELDDAAQAILRQACESLDRMRQAQALIKEHGLLIDDRFGQKKGNPACVVERDAKSQFLQALRALGLDSEALRDTVGRPPAGGGR